MTHTPLPEPGYTHLCGVDMATLGQLEDLREQATRRELTLPQWRERFTQAMADVDAQPPEEVAVLLDAAREASSDAWARAFSARYEDTAAGEPDEATLIEVDARRQHLSDVVKHLVLLEGPPTDDQVMTDLPARDREVREAGVDLTGEARDRFMARVERDEALHAAWLVDLDGTARDAGSGLPEAAVAAQRSVTEPGLGEMPVGLPEARARAWIAADAEERLRATAVAKYPTSSWNETGWRMQEAQHGLRRAVVTELLKFAYARSENSPEALTLVELWEQQDLRGFIREFLDDVGAIWGER